jgi:uncharacterized protein YjdB
VTDGIGATPPDAQSEQLRQYFPLTQLFTMRRILTILAAGTLALSACSDDSVGPPPNYVFVVIPNQSEISLTQDDSTEVSVIVKDTVSGGQMYFPQIDWSSDDPDIAVVEENDDGWQVRAVGAGSTQLHAVFNSAHGSVEGTIDVSVTGVPPASFVIGPDADVDDLGMYPGDADTLEVHIQDADGNDLDARRIAWTNSNEDAASVETFSTVTADTTIAGADTTVETTVSYFAVVTADSLGDAEITGEVDGHSQTLNVSITPRPVAVVVMDPDAGALHVGESMTITATPKGANGEALDRDIAWASADTTVATVDETGKVTAVGTGTVEITATSDGKVGTATILVVAGEN